SRLWRPPQRNALHQRTAALRYLPRLACRDPDDLFRQDHVLERKSRGAPGLGHETAAGMIVEAVPARRAFAEERATAQGDRANLNLAFGNALPVRFRPECSTPRPITGKKTAGGKSVGSSSRVTRRWRREPALIWPRIYSAARWGAPVIFRRHSNR